MGETPGHREAIDRMTRQIVDNNRGKVSAEQARKIARDAAIRNDKKKR
jgi:hypothetical protein